MTAHRGREGSGAISFEPDNWTGLTIHVDASPAAFTRVKFQAHGGTAGGQIARLFLDVNGANRLNVALTDIGPPLAANGWRTYEATLAVGVAAGQLWNLTLQD